MIPRPRNRLIICGLLLTLSVGTGCGSASGKRARHGIHVQHGIEAYGRGDYDRALYSFQRALQFDPDAPETYLYIGQLYDDYLNNNAEAIAYYEAFAERSRDEKLVGWVKQWIAKAQADVAAGREEPPPETPAELEEAYKALQAKYAKMLTERQKAPAVAERTANRPQLLPRLLAGIIGAVLGAIAVTVLLLTRAGRLGGRAGVIAAPPPRPVLSHGAVVGRFFWVENEFNLGTVSISEQGGRLRVESTSLSTNARSVGYGTLDKDTLHAELLDDSGLKAPTAFRFAADGNSFTAEWADDLGPGVAIGVRER